VTGNNKYFCLARAEATRLRLPDEDLVPISPPGSRHLRGLKFTRQAWETLASDGARCLLFYPRDKLRAGANRYVAKGESDDVHHAYKCAVRSPWWQVPLVAVPDLFLTYMNHERPRLFTGRDDPAGRDEQYEKMYLLLLDASPSNVDVKAYEVGHPETEIPMAQILDDLIGLVAERNPDFYEFVDGHLVPVRG
jgi:hypothetical protein